MCCEKRRLSYTGSARAEGVQAWKRKGNEQAPHSMSRAATLLSPPGPPPLAGALERALASCFLVRDGEAYLRRNVFALQEALTASVDQLRFFYSRTTALTPLGGSSTTWPRACPAISKGNS
jgi:hypothetical protein